MTESDLIFRCFASRAFFSCLACGPAHVHAGSLCECRALAPGPGNDADKQDIGKK